jgi:esterase/lipase superfamily enzyme
LYDLGRRNAEGKGSDALIELVESVFVANGGQRIDIVAHSLGCHLVLEAIKKKPELASRIRELVLLAPAVHYAALEDQRISLAITQLSRIHVYYSRHDSILRIFASFRHASPMLGAIGPKSPSLLPSNITVHDVTEKLGNRDVHGSYLRTNGLKSLNLHQILR